MVERFSDTQVGIMQFNIFPHQSNFNTGLLALKLCNHCFPTLYLGGLFGFEFQPFHEDIRNMGLFKHQGNFIQQIRCHQGDYSFLANITKLGNFV